MDLWMEVRSGHRLFCRRTLCRMNYASRMLYSSSERSMFEAIRVKQIHRIWVGGVAGRRRTDVALYSKSHAASPPSSTLCSRLCFVPQISPGPELPPRRPRYPPSGLSRLLARGETCFCFSWTHKPSRTSFLNSPRFTWRTNGGKNNPMRLNETPLGHRCGRSMWGTTRTLFLAFAAPVTSRGDPAAPQLFLGGRLRAPRRYAD